MEIDYFFLVIKERKKVMVCGKVFCYEFYKVYEVCELDWKVY